MDCVTEHRGVTQFILHYVIFCLVFLKSLDFFPSAAIYIKKTEMNTKKSIRITNKTKNFNPKLNRTHNTISSPHTYTSRQQKIEAYETRLYWQYRYCDEHDGQTFFYTLTYNDKHLPSYYGVPCFDYQDLVDIVFEGAFRKRLLRQYGTKMKYFVGAELGDGKGERGMHNNPHYHILFFLEPANNKRYPYRKIDPKQFRHEVRLAWQGFDEEEGWHDYRTAKLGIAREGEPKGIKMATYGKVKDFRACTYCAKYVCKDIKLVRAERFIYRHLREDLIDLYRYKPEVLREFFEQEMIIPEDADDDLKFKYALAAFDYDRNYKVIEKIIEVQGLTQKYLDFVEEYIAEPLNEKLKEFRNRHTNKCRISHGVGDYALEHIDDLMNPTIQVPSKNGFKNRPIGMYYYRKLYTNYYIDKDGSVIRYLNLLGVDYKRYHLKDNLQKISTRAENNLRCLLNSETLYDTLKKSDINEQIYLPFKDFFEEYNYLLVDENKDIEEICKRYGEYKFIYEDRFFPYQASGTICSDSFPVLHPVYDYSRFISAVPVTGDGYRSLFFLESPDKDYLPYFSHPYFLRYMWIFHLLDLCADYFYIQEDNRKQEQAEEIAAVRRFHSERELKKFYAGFLN